MRNPSFYNEIASICGQGRALSGPAAMLSYESDGLGFHRHKPDWVAIPGNQDELRRLMDAARSHGVPYVIRGAGTGLSGACVAEQGGLMIHLSRLKRILEIRPEDLTCVVEPGVVLNALNDALEPLGVFYP